MGFETFGFGFGREDIFEPEEIFWGAEDTWLGDERYSGDRNLAKPFGAVQMGLIYVNPEGPNGNPHPAAAAKDIRDTFGRMAMNDEETVALIVGGHTFGKTHGAVSSEYIGPEPEAAPIEQQLLGWKNSYRTGNGAYAMTSGLDGGWTNQPTKWDNGFLENLYRYDWELTKSPAGAHQRTPKNPEAQGTVPDAHDASKRHAPMILTTDLALKLDPVYGPMRSASTSIPRHWRTRSRGPGTSSSTGTWVRRPGCSARGSPSRKCGRTPVPSVDHPLIDGQDIEALKGQILACGLSISQLVRTAWAAAASFRGTDKRGGANGARLRLSPQKDWEVNEPPELAKVLGALEAIQREFNRAQRDGKRVSLADLIVIGGSAAVERAARDAGCEVSVPVTPGRTDATQEQTDVDSFAVLEPTFDGVRNYLQPGQALSPENLLIERANLLALTDPEMTVLVGGMRVLGANYKGSQLGVVTDRRATLTNDFFVNLLDMGTEWLTAPSGNGSSAQVYEGRDRAAGEVRWTATAVDLVFGSNDQLRAIAEVDACDDARSLFVQDFVAAWAKVMNLDRFDLA